jgi:hypothetical protein
MLLHSESWSLGGTWGSWDGRSGTVDAETPLEFTEFDRLLEVVCPNISFLGYKKLKSQCCQLDSRVDSDYYGGSSTNVRHVCNLQELFDSLNEMNLIS